MSHEWWELISLAAVPSKLPQLPTEVWERTLDELDELDGFPFVHWEERRRTFAACCLICRAWLPRSRYHLFKYVKVQSKEQVKEVSKMLGLIPALRTRVERLSVRGGRGGKKDASWIGLVGFYLGPKLKSLSKIEMRNVDLSLTKLQSYQFWGAFNRAWKPGATRQLEFSSENTSSYAIAHLDQLFRLVFVTKTGELHTSHLRKQVDSTLRPPVLPSGISLPLCELTIGLQSSDLLFPMEWNTLARQCPSLSSVKIICSITTLDFSSRDGHLFMVSIFDLFCCMQRRNNTVEVILWIDSLPKLTVRTKPVDQPTNTDNPLLATPPRLCRELVLDHGFTRQFAHVLGLLEDVMVLENYANKRFHHIEITYPPRYGGLQPEYTRPLDAVLSRLRVVTPEVNVVVNEGNSPHEGCVLPWAMERFPLFSALVPNAFCDPAAGRPCKSHPKRAGSKRGK